VNDSLSIVLFSGTEDKLHAAGTIAAGAAAMGRPVSILLMYWALDAFRADRIENDHGLAYDAARPRFNEPVERMGDIPWLETFRQAKEIGEVSARRPWTPSWIRRAGSRPSSWPRKTASSSSSETRTTRPSRPSRQAPTQRRRTQR
jgi:predicted peroxiredoxin